MKLIVSAISLLIATIFGALRIWKAAKSAGTSEEKITAVHAELVKIVSKFDSLAKNTDPTWDDTLASVLSEALDAIAENIISQLEG